MRAAVWQGLGEGEGATQEHGQNQQWGTGQAMRLPSRRGCHYSDDA